MAYDKVHHYVPKFLLRNFGTGKKDRIHVFDKKTRRSYSTNVKNIACESGFYDFDVDGVELTLEPSLAKVESVAKPLIAGILSSDSVKDISPTERAELSAFFALQMTRTRNFRERFTGGRRLLAEKVGPMVGRDRGQLSPELEEILRPQDENQAAFDTARFMVKSVASFWPHFANKSWNLLRTDSAHPFMIGDNPVAMQNTLNKPHPVFGNIGLAVAGIEIYLPISSRRALGLWCPTVLRHFEERASQGFVDAQELVHLIRSSTPIPYGPSHVENFNFLQVAYSERFVMRATGDFSLAERMIAGDPSFSLGPRMQLN